MRTTSNCMQHLIVILFCLKGVPIKPNHHCIWRQTHPGRPSHRAQHRACSPFLAAERKIYHSNQQTIANTRVITGGVCGHGVVSANYRSENPIQRTCPHCAAINVHLHYSHFNNLTDNQRLVKARLSALSDQKHSNTFAFYALLTTLSIRCSMFLSSSSTSQASTHSLSQTIWVCGQLAWPIWTPSFTFCRYKKQITRSRIVLTWDTPRFGRFAVYSFHSLHFIVLLECTYCRARAMRLVLSIRG